MLPEELLWVVALSSTTTYHDMVTAIPQLARKITLGTQCNHKIHFGYDVKVEKDNYYYCIVWRLNSKLHRTDGPAIERAGGNKSYYINGKLHRTDGPAVEWVDGVKEYWFDGKRHRTDGPAIEYSYGHKEYYRNGKRHRTDGPAIEYAYGVIAYFQDNKAHRTDGPAIETIFTGEKEYVINGIEYTLQDYHLMTFSY